MQVRTPNLDFSDIGPIWAPANPAFGHKFDAASLLFPYLEPFLIRVMRQGKERLHELGLNTSEIDQNIHWFNQQEAQHYQVHTRYNDYLKSHYTGLEEFEAEIKGDFDRMLEQESLAYNLGYSAAFESIGPIQVPVWFSLAKEARQGADKIVDELWGWHLSEEFEHRCVAFDVYQLLVGKWAYRLKLFAIQSQHLDGFTKRVMEHMVEQDHQAGRFERDTAIALLNAFEKKLNRAVLPKLFHLAMPWYNPLSHTPPAESIELLNAYR